MTESAAVNEESSEDSLAVDHASDTDFDAIEAIHADSGSDSAAGSAGMPEQDESSAISSGALMAAGTIVSRITGVMRDIAITAALGLGIVADAYALGNSLPNVVYILVVGGALNAVFIPQLVRHMKHDSDGGDGYADRLLTLVAMILITVSILAVIFAPFLIRLYASADIMKPENASAYSLAVLLARFCLPQILFYGLYTMFSQVLNARMKFGAPMFAPIVNNVVMIATALVFIWLVAGATLTSSSLTSGQITLLGIGTTLGVAAQALVLIPVLRRAGYKWRPRFDFRGHGLGKAGGLAGWTIGLVLINQIGFIVITKLATQANFIAATQGLAPQGLATYQRALLVFMLPHSVITISLVTALVPRMSKSAADGKLNEVADDVSGGMRLIGSLLVPCVIALALFGPMVGTVFFSFGKGSGSPAIYTGVVVSCFALALLPFSLFYVLLRGWYSTEDTRTPFFVTVAYNVIAVPLTLGFFALAPNDFKVAAMALAYGISYWITLAIAWVLLGRRLGGLNTRPTAIALLKMVIAGLISGVVAALVVFGGYSLLRGTPIGNLYGDITASRFTSLLVLIIGGMVVLVAYLGILKILRIKELSEIISTIRVRIGR